MSAAISGPFAPNAFSPFGDTSTTSDTAAATPSFYFDQSTPTATWTIVHNLNKTPVHVTAIDTAYAPLEGAESYDNPNQVTLTFSAAVSGSAYVS